MKVLVTGGAGFIGSHIVDSLISKGHNVVVIDDLSTSEKTNINPKAKFYKADVTREIDQIFSSEKPEVVIHTAAQVLLRDSIERPLLDAKLNIIGSLNVLECCRRNNIKKVIYTSTGGARYGEPKYLPVDEDHPINPTTPYGISKHTAEHYFFAYHQLYGIDYLIFCFGNVYGPRDDPRCKRVIPVFIDRVLKGERPVIFGDGNQTRDFIYVRDLAEFIVESINKNPKHKLFNLANGIQIKINEIISILEEVSGIPISPEHTEAIRGEVRDIYLDTKLAESELGWKPRHNLKQGLKETFERFKNERLNQQGV